MSQQSSRALAMGMRVDGSVMWEEEEWVEEEDEVEGLSKRAGILRNKGGWCSVGVESVMVKTCLESQVPLVKTNSQVLA